MQKWSICYGRPYLPEIKIISKKRLSNMQKEDDMQVLSSIENLHQSIFPPLLTQLSFLRWKVPGRKSEKVPRVRKGKSGKVK